MRTLLALFVSSLISGLTQAQTDTSHRFTIAGTVANSKYPTMTLLYLAMDGNRVYDSVKLQEGKFFFGGYVKEPSQAMLRNSPSMGESKNVNENYFYLEPGIIEVTSKCDDFANWVVTGSESNIEYEDYNKQWKKLDRNAPNFQEEFEKLEYTFIKSHRNSYLSAYNLNYYRTRWPLDTVKSLYNNFTTEVQNSIEGKEILEAIVKVEDNSPGKPAKLFAAKDFKGKVVKLENYKSSYVILDFWASWCGPCRESTPKLLKWYSLYHKKGLQVVGVSSDWERKDWIKAIKKDGISIWPNVLSEDSAYMASQKTSIRENYGIGAIPSVKILIDKSGMIIGRYTGTDEDAELEKQLAKLFKTAP